ncbi:MAG: hypothetical protein A2381_17940 [Bdellovibrionales bacterium RIFOXYB1_FULL_37_110]|nr:MAG: hypothetical protein A2417_08730 [Bdellovibrionales bacterium RIFOXYC1_FULL_37_79]OFZ59851.1 MAG: hypothetical protein A2381_17940 [Bdellovibrionales bacterium RIFOXYB1_FULL_37_110]OFZ65465.1 MAG: hypothetical protein A2577_18475 [Bdellovibrionales bacterium RIFOXYD1_FULL_36_51]
MIYKIFPIGWLIFFMTISCTPTRETINIDGSSTIFPISKSIAEEYNKKNPIPQINIHISGTSGGFRKFCTDKIDISNASRVIKTTEVNLAKANNINYIELPIAYDGITVVINKNNTWASEMTTEELSRIWNNNSKIFKWSDIRPHWPDRKIKLYGPDTDSGTLDYFMEAINDKPQISREDFIKNQDHHALLTSITEEIDSLGFLGYSFYKKNRDKLKAVALSYKNNSWIAPDVITISNGTYKPLIRILYLYVNTDKLKQKKSLRDFMNFFMEVAPGMVGQAGYIQLNDDQYTRNLITLEKYSLFEKD